MSEIFLTNISEHLFEIKNEFQIKIKRLGLAFDEDIFSDTLIKCNEKLSNEDNDKKEMIAYFWMAFKKNTLRDLNYSRNKLRGEMPQDINIDLPFDASEDFDNITNIITNKFGCELYKLFALHANGTPYDELECKYSQDELKYKFRRIREYVRKNYKLLG